MIAILPPSPPEAPPVLFQLPTSTRHPTQPAAPYRRKPLKLETTGLTPQTEFWQSAHVHKESIAAKLREGGQPALAQVLDDCCSDAKALVCASCGKFKTFFTHCDNFFCPCCQARLSRARRREVEWWTKAIGQPKHVVLTVRNAGTLDKTYLKWFKACLGKLRRRKFARNWHGGFYSIEVTNEGRGWHVHAHLLIDARFIDNQALAVEWANIVGQDFAIVKVKDVRQKSYLNEVTKYAVKSHDLARWSAADVVAFVVAVKGSRMFGTFGSLFKQRGEWREFIDTQTREPEKCPCGCTLFRIMDARLAEVYEPEFPSTRPRPPPCSTSPQLSLPV